MKKILISLFILLIFLTSFFLMIQNVKAIVPWSHSENQVPFDGYYANYEGWFYDVVDPLNPESMLYNWKISNLYTDLDPSEDYQMLINITNIVGIILMPPQVERSSTILSITNRSLFDRKVMESNLTVYTPFSLIEEGLYDVFWCLNNLTLGDVMVNTSIGLLVWDIQVINIPLGQFQCFHGQLAIGNPGVDLYEYTGAIVDFYYDIHSGALLRAEVKYIFPIIRKTMELTLVSSNLPILSTNNTTQLLILFGLVGGIFAVFVALRYRGAIVQLIRPSVKKKDTRKKSKKRRKVENQDTE